jgi:hypothetical protein
MPLARPVASAPTPWRHLPAGLLAGMGRLDAGYCLRERQLTRHWSTLAELGAQVGEGQRSGRGEGSAASCYRPSHLSRGLVVPDDRHLRAEPRSSPRSVGPGDVLVGKFLPARAALASSATPRHSPDGNCLRVVGLRPGMGLWLTALLNHPRTMPVLSRLSDSRSLPRLGARDLAEWPIPPPPTDLAS